jgi:hypothetical protein
MVLKKIFIYFIFNQSEAFAAFCSPEAVERGHQFA